MKAKTDADTTSGNRTIIEGGILHSPNALIINANCAHCPMAATCRIREDQSKEVNL